MMDRIRHLLLVFAFGLLIGSVNAQSDTAFRFTLKEAQDFAIKNYFASKNAQLDIQAAKKKVWETTAIGLPQVSGNLSYQYIPGDIPEFDFMGPIFGLVRPTYEALGMPTGFFDSLPGGSPIASRQSTTYSLTVSQLIFSGEYIVGLQASRIYKSLSELNAEKTEDDVKENVAGTYHAILVLNDNVATLEKILDQTTLTYKHTQKYAEQGLIDQTDVDQMQIIINNTKNSINTIKRQVAFMNNLLKFQLGLGNADNVALTDNLDSLVGGSTINETDYSFLIDDDVSYRLLKTQTELMQLDYKRNKSLFLPTVAGFYQYSDKTNKAALDFTMNHILGLSVNVPIFSSGQRLSKVSQAKIEFVKAQNMQEQQSEMITIAAFQAKDNYTSANEKYANEKLNIELADRVLKNATARYKEGLISSIELAQANNQYLQAQMSYSAAIQELLKAKITLDKAYNKL